MGLLGLSRVVGSSGWRQQHSCGGSNHVLADAGCTPATSTATPDIVRLLVTSWSGAEDRGRDWRDSGAGGWPAAAGRHPEQPRLLPASVGGKSLPGKHPAAHSAQASEDTQAAAVQTRGRGGRKTSGTRALDLVRLSAAASLWRLPVSPTVRLETNLNYRWPGTRA